MLETDSASGLAFRNLENAIMRCTVCKLMIQDAKILSDKMFYSAFQASENFS